MTPSLTLTAIGVFWPAKHMHIDFWRRTRYMDLFGKLSQVVPVPNTLRRTTYFFLSVQPSIHCGQTKWALILRAFSLHLFPE